MHGNSVEGQQTLNQLLGKARLEWHGVQLHKPDVSLVSHSIALTAWSSARQVVFHYIINAYWKPLTFQLPSPKKMPGGVWHRWIDTSRPSPEDIVPWDAMQPVTARTYRIPGRSLVVLITRSIDSPVG
jgi:glycogen operon protein